jgi:hypothetical protein
MTEPMERLLPCPFCGEKRIFMNEPSKFHRYGAINCPACLVLMPGETSNIDELISAWNVRADAQGALLPALIEIRNWCMVEGCSEQVDVADKAMIAAGVKDIPCFQCSGDGQWDEGPLPARSSAQISPEYRTVICEECTGSGRLHFSLTSAERKA